MGCKRWRPAEEPTRRRVSEQAVALDSTFALAWLELAQLYSPDSEQEAARAFANRAWDCRAHLGVKDLLLAEATMENLNGRDTESRQTYGKILERWPDDREALRWVAGAYLSSWNAREAIRVSEQGLRLYPDDEDLLGIHRNAMTWGRQPQLALLEWNSYVGRHLADPTAWCGRARCFTAMGLPDSARSSAEVALRLTPNDYDAQYFLGLCAFGRGDLQEAIGVLERTVSRSDVPGSRRAWTIFGIGIGLRYLYLEAGRIDAALRAWHRAEAIAGIRGTQSKRRIENFLVWSLVSCNRPREAYTIWQKWRGLSDLDRHDRWEVEAWHAAALIGLDSLQAARASILKLRADLTPAWPSVWDLRTEMLTAGSLEIAAGDPKAALEALDRSRSIDATLSEFHVWRQTLYARAYRLDGDLERASAACQDLLRIYAGCARARFLLAQIDDQRGRSDQAVLAYRECVRLWSGADPGHRERAIAEKRLAFLQNKAPSH